MSRQTAILIMATAALVTITATTAHADHVDNHIWIETANGDYVTDTKAIRDTFDNTLYTEPYICAQHGGGVPKRIDITLANPETLNTIDVLSSPICGVPETEKSQRLAHHTIHECLCGYWYANTLKNEYKYTILDLPKDRETPPNYEQIVEAGVKAGLDRWGDINNITITHTDSRLEANIVIQQQIGDGSRTYGNAEVGCLFGNNQCTIQLFTDLDIRDKQTLVNTHSIEWTVAHEFGHLMGLPHHIEPDHIMNTIHHSNVRDYWEARNINVPRMTEPTFEQRLLENENDYLDYTDEIDTDEIPTDIDGIMRHEKVTEFLEFIQIVLLNTPEDDRLRMWWDIAENAFQALRTTIHP